MDCRYYSRNRQYVVSALLSFHSLRRFALQFRAENRPRLRDPRNYGSLTDVKFSAEQTYCVTINPVIFNVTFFKCKNFQLLNL